MKKLIIAAALIFSPCAGVFSQEAVTIPVKYDFRLNPVLGIRGDKLDADSRFAQRMIFSTLVMPMTDPVIDYNFEYDIPHSLIKEVQRYDGSRFLKEYSLSSPDDFETAVKFRILLREGLYFMRGRTKTGDAISAEDVVFSYRTAQTTLSLSSGNTYINAILRAQLADLERVAYIAHDTVEFAFKTDRTAKSFIRFLAFTPILPVKQLRAAGDKNQEHTDYVFSKDTPDAYRMSAMKGLEAFERQPDSYGQYSVEDRITPSSQAAPPYAVAEVRLRKNPYWTPNGTPMVLTKDGLGRHGEYANDRESLIIKKDANMGITSILNSDRFLINHPLNVKDYTGNTTYLARPIQDDAISAEKMYISYKLYGLFFSPRSKMFYEPDIRSFISGCVNREMMYRSIMTDNDSLNNSEEKIKRFLNKIEAYPMYYPFFGGIARGGGRTEEPQNLSELNEYCKTHDLSYSTYPTLKDDLERYLSMNAGKQITIASYFRGKLWEDYLAALGRKFAELQRAIRIEEKMKDSGGVITIRILYDREDKIAETLKLLLERNLIDLFKYLEKEQLLQGKANIISVPLEKGDIKTMHSQYDIAVYGWDYRFDFMSDINSLFSSNDPNYGELQRMYEEYLKNIQNNAVSERLMFRVANYIRETRLMAALIGVQNYILWDKRRLTMSSLARLDRHSIMFPYYWRKTSEIR